MPSDARNYITAVEFLTHPAAAGPSELVRGTIHVTSPSGGRHGVIVANVFAALDAFVRERGLGLCFADNTGFELAGLLDTVRSPDAAFVSGERLPAEGIGPGWVRATPDLIVEVLSPSESVAELEAKLDDYRTAGTRRAWIIDPTHRTVTIRDLAGELPEHILAEREDIDAAPVLPGFSMWVARIFDRLPR